MEVIVEAISLKDFPQSCQMFIGSGLRTATYKVTILVDGKDMLTCDFSGKGLNNSKKAKLVGGNENNDNLGSKFTCKILDKSSVNVKIECKHSGLHSSHEVSSTEIIDVGKKIKLNSDTALNLSYIVKNEQKSGTLTLKITRVSTTSELKVFKLPNVPKKCLYTASDLEGLGIVSQVLKGEDYLKCPEWVNLLGAMGKLLKVAEPVGEVDPHARIALTAGEVAFELIMKQKDRDERILGLVEVMGSTYQMILDSNPLGKCLTLSQSVNDLIALTRECSYFVAEYVKTGPFGQRAVINAFSNADVVITQFEGKFLKIKEIFFTGIILSIGQVTMQILEKLEVMDNKLDLIFDVLSFPVLGHSWSKLDGCIEETQKPILSAIYEWGFENNRSVPNIFLLLGVSNFGKTAIAHTVSSFFYDRGRLGATIFFDCESSLNPANFFPSIIRELSSYHPAVHAQVMTGLKTRNVKFINDPPAKQFHFLVSQVLNGLTLIGPLLLVIDNLDQCADRDVILQLLVKFPKNIRLLITSEPADDVVSAFSAKAIMREMNSIEDQDLWSSLKLYISGFLKVLEESRPVLFRVHPWAEVAEEIFVKSGEADYLAQAMLQMIATMQDKIALTFIEEIFTFALPENETMAKQTVMQGFIGILSGVDDLLELGHIARYTQNQAESVKKLLLRGFLQIKNGQLDVANMCTIVGVNISLLRNLYLLCEPSTHCSVSNALLAVPQIKDIEHLTKVYRECISRALHCILTCKCSHPPEATKQENKSTLEYLLKNHQKYCIREARSPDVSDVTGAIQRHHTILKNYVENSCFVVGTSEYCVVNLTPPLYHSGSSASVDNLITLLCIRLFVYSSADIKIEAAIYRAVTAKGQEMLSQMQTKLGRLDQGIEPYSKSLHEADVQIMKNPLNGKKSWLVKNTRIHNRCEVLWFNCPIPMSVHQNYLEDDAKDGLGIGFVNSLLPGDRIAILAKSNDASPAIETELTLFTDPKETCPPTQLSN